MATKWVQLAYLARRTALASIVESGPCHTGLDETGTECVDANVSLLELVRRGFSNGVHAKVWSDTSLPLCRGSTYAALLALSERGLNTGDGM